MIVLQISALIIVSGSLGGMLVFTDVYEEVHSGIVSVLCLSCLKLEPKTKTNYPQDRYHTHKPVGFSTYKRNMPPPKFSPKRAEYP